MAISSKAFGMLGKSAFSKKIDWSATSSDTFKAALYVQAIPGTAQDNWQFLSDVTGISEVSATGGYSSGGQTITGLTATYVPATNTMVFDCNDIVWTNSTISAASCIIYNSTGTPSSSALVAYVDFGGTLSSTSASFSIIIDANGLFNTVTA